MHAHAAISRLELGIRIYANDLFVDCDQRLYDFDLGDQQEETVIPSVCGLDVQWTHFTITPRDGLRCDGCGRYSLKDVPLIEGGIDLFLMDTRNDDVDPDALAWTGRYIQALVKRRAPLPGGGVWFGDETDAWVKGQEATTPERLPNGEPLVNGSAGFAKHDVDRDGGIDLVMVRQGQRPGRHAPLVYLNNGSGQLLPMSADSFLRADMYFGDTAAPADVNGDGAVDFGEVELHEGSDGVIHTEDDFGRFVTLLNTTPPRLPRCAS